jgi:RNA polymerase sigma factor (sigma-70 family)
MPHQARSLAVPVRSVELRNVHLECARPSPLDLAETSERGRMLADCMGGFPVQHRRLIEMRYVDDLTFAEIATEFAVSEPAVHKMHGRILENIQRALVARKVFFFDQI